ncbi:hypothetical protein [Xenorhabdus sp. TH1]|uniref:hypothetical protein n=1 Tax=Xenorhabdus sp. TH1 TaxID=3130166 RepID=UPI0030CD38E5
MQMSLELNTMNKILFIETRGMNPTGILKTAIELGYYPWVVTEQREEWQTHLSEQNINCTLLSVSQLTAQHIINVLPHRPKAVITLSDQYLEIGAEVAKYLELPHTPLEVLADCRNKYITRKRVSRTTVKQPNFVKVDNFDADIFLSKTLPFTVSKIKSNTDRFGFLIISSDDLSLLNKKVNNIIVKMNIAILPSQE